MEKTDQKPLQKEKRTRSAGRIAGMAAGIAVGVLAAAYLAVCIAAAAGRTTLHRTRVLGVDVGGLTAQEVRDKWQRDGADACSGEVIHLTLGEETIGQVSWGIRYAAGGGPGCLERGPWGKFLRQRVSPDPQLVWGDSGGSPVGSGRGAAVPAGGEPEPGAEP